MLIISGGACGGAAFMITQNFRNSLQSDVSNSDLGIAVMCFLVISFVLAIVFYACRD